MCFALRLHTSAAPPQGGLTQALGAIMKISIEQPNDFVHGVWQVVIVLDAEENELIQGQLAFDVPDIPERFFRVDPDFRGQPPFQSSYPFHGKFLNGEWRGVVQADGVPEERCVTPLKAIESALRKSIDDSLNHYRA